ncbi:uncharacterized protein [Malus domestica]|uniref:uncharacterized protein isoform X5 n=1 Tax=Malus domestica TaxID=3750 RepID=UPI0039756776
MSNFNTRMEVEVFGRIRCAYSFARFGSSLSINGAIIGPSRTLSSAMYVESKRVRVWTESKQVMVATVKRGWKTLVLGSKSHELADEWSSMH